MEDIFTQPTSQQQEPETKKKPIVWIIALIVVPVLVGLLAAGAVYFSVGSKSENELVNLKTEKEKAATKASDLEEDNKELEKNSKRLKIISKL